jgi:hypothetical protein
MSSRPPLPEKGPIDVEVAPADSEAPEAFENLDGDGTEGSLEGSDSTLSPPPAESEVQSLDKKRKRLEDLTSSGSSKPKDVPQEQSTSKDPPHTMFDLLDS